MKTQRRRDAEEIRKKEANSETNKRRFILKISASLRLCVFIFLLAIGTFAQTTKDYARYVNPFIGTGGHGHTFPGATVPFGMVQLSPDTRIDNWDGSSGYHYSDSVIYGFSHTHLSGTGIPDYCDILFMPGLGEPQFSAKEGEKTENGYASRFSHANEKAEPGYYLVKLDDDNIFAEMTATARVGFHRYTFPQSDKANIILDLKWRDKVLDSEIKVVGKNRIEGFRRSSSWAKDQIVYFVAEFSKPFESVFTQYSDPRKITVLKIIENSKKRNLNPVRGTDLKTAFKFRNPKNEPILVKVAISPVSVEGARKNLAAELPHWNFEKVRSDAKAAWNKELSKIEVSGGTEAQMTNFYTALYHTMIHPNIFQDYDGSYRGMDGKIHNIADFSNPKSKIQNPKSDHYTVFSLWDTFRAAHPLYTIIDQKRTVDFINTFIRQYEQGGRLPVWELAGNETDTMIGYHAVSVIADAMAKGIEGFDYEKAYAAAKHSAELDHFGLAAYKKRGYISMEDEQESVSKTLEYAYNDFCIAQMAKILERQKLSAVRSLKDAQDGGAYFRDHEKYIRRARSFENLFDAETGFMRPKQNGGFVKPFAPNEVTFHFTEGNSWQYSFFVPHDVSRLIELYGGKQNFAKKLDELFTTEQKLTGRVQPDITGLIGQYAHGNEPSHHVAYLFNYAGEPWKTQFYVRKILDEFYKPTPDGLIGNEDCGQMSAWYVLSAAGFYPVAPGIANYDLGAPIFRQIKFNLENGKTFIITAPNVSDKNFYVKSVKLNGKPYAKTFIAHDAIASGGALEFEMSSAPVKTVFSLFSQSGVAQNLVAVPLIEGAARVFKNENLITLKTTTRDAKILYSIDGNEPKIEYKSPFVINVTSTVKAVTVNSKSEKSLPAEARFFKKPNDWTVKIFSQYNRQYTGGGDEGLIDGIRGTTNFASGEWQGYQAQDFVAVIDLQRETEIKRLGGGFLQIARSWIWMPTRVEFEISNDGENFRPAAEIKTTVAPDDMEHKIRDYKTDIAPVKARYVRVKAVNFGKIPAWHPGAGFDAFIFVDEIFIE
jgi:predicted alpha-1,2-mannosidase